MPQAPATTITEIVERASRVIQNVNAAQASAKYTRYPARRSAIFSIGARERSARSTSSMIRPKAVSCPTLSVLDLQNAGLVHGSGKYAGAGNLFHWHRFTSDVGLVHERMAADDHPSTGICPPGRTSTTSPTWTFDMPRGAT